MKSYLSREPEKDSTTNVIPVTNVNVKGKELVTDAPQDESDAEFDIFSPPGRPTNNHILSTLDEYFSHINLSQRNNLKELQNDFSAEIQPIKQPDYRTSPLKKNLM